MVCILSRESDDYGSVFHNSIAKWSFIVADRLDAGERLREPIAKNIVAVLIGLILRTAVVAAPSSLPENHKPERRRTWRRTDALTSGWRRLASAMPRLPRSRLAIYVHSLMGGLLSTTLITTGFHRKRGHFGGFKAWLNQRLSQEITSSPRAKAVASPSFTSVRNSPGSTRFSSP